jgi:outer membrane protein assembly factor BamB
MPSPLLYQKRIYLIRDGGMLTCFDSETGRLIFDRKRVGAVGQYCASPVAADGHIYVESVAGVVTVIKAGDQYEALAANDLHEGILATPAVAEDKIYFRTARHLWAFGKIP